VAVTKATARRLSVAVVAVAMMASSCSTSEPDLGYALPSAPEVRDVRSTAQVVPDDGLLRVTVVVPDGPDVSSGRADSEDAVGIAGTLEANDAANALSFDDLIDIPSDSTLAMRDDVLGYLGPDGTFVPLSTQENGTASDLDFGLAGEADKVAFLSALPGVVTVRTITPSTFAVSATSTEAMETLGFALAEDLFLTFSTDPYEPYQWALENDGSSLSNVGLPQAPSQSPDADVDGVEAREGATGLGVVVAVIDAGVDFSHPDLTHARWLNPNEDCSGTPNGVDDDGNGFVDDCGGWDFGDEDATPFDGRNDEHGTHVAGIIAARSGNGVGIAGIAPDAEIMDLKVSDASGMISMTSIARAIRYATDNGADVVNLSLGTLPGASLESVAVLGDAVDYANSRGVLLVAAAGNSGISLDNSPVYPASFGTPNLLVVAASTSADQRASFSNTGSDVDLFAPGDLILSTIPGGEVVFMSGTSQAAPIAAATAALLLERNSGFDPSTVIDQLVRSSDQLDSLRGLAANPVRLNSARAVGIEGDLLGSDDPVTIRGLAADDAGRVSASVSMPNLSGQFNEPFHWEVSLLTLVDGDPFAVVDHPVTVHDVEGDELRSTQTDRRGAVLLADEASRLAEWSTVLPTGSYALLVEAVPWTDATARLGDAFLVRFDVGDPAGSSNDDDGASGQNPGSPETDAPDPAGDPGLGTVVDSGPVSDNGSPVEPGTTDGGSVDDGSSGHTPCRRQHWAIWQWCDRRR
jgi:subtilisin family serine protease